ncbi:MAG: MMPL family transporter [Planctomycetes bacterium]|nr:MMPL family transporter [Planctomycetota bacterium]
MVVDLKQKLTNFSIIHYKFVTIVMLIVVLILGSFITRLKVDTDPENMLSADEAVRVFHKLTKERFNLYDMVVVGIVNNKHADGVFNPESLSKIYELTEFAKTLSWPDEHQPDEHIGVVEVDLLAPSTVDHIGQGGPGVLTFEWLMPKPPATSAEALEIRDKLMGNPLLKGTLISEDGKAVCLYLPLTSKDLSYRVYRQLKEKIATFEGDEAYYITGLPVAEDTFGVEMFIQMAISAPLAMFVIFLLMLFFFRKLVLVISPMIVALVSIISTMGLLAGFGYPVHIMSSMIPIFLMPIAVVDSVHILSEFFDLYTKEKGRMNTIKEVMSNLFTPMFYTSLTSAVGFASLALTPIPPVQVFGIFVAVGILIAWICTITFIPAYIMMIREKSLEHFGQSALGRGKPNRLTRLLNKTGNFTYSKAKPILVVMIGISVVAVFGITRIQINDNPVKWFSKSHPIRQADIELNKHFGGTYMAYLVFEDATKGEMSGEYADTLRNRWEANASELVQEIPQAKDLIGKIEGRFFSRTSNETSKEAYLDNFIEIANQNLRVSEEAADDAVIDAWYEIVAFFETEREKLKLFKQPEVLEYIANLQSHLKASGLVGKSNSVADVVKKVHQELIDGKPESYVIPKTSAAVAQCLLQFQSSHHPEDLWHLVTTDYSKANVWFQLTSGDNQDMNRVVRAVDVFFAEHPPPVPVQAHWAGLTYINTVWQDKMVFGMLKSFSSSFLIVFIMMTILFRSPLWGIIGMIPLTVTIIVIYGIIGWIGKDFDMPVAVLSALTLGLAVDFAIHFLERSRSIYSQTGSWSSTVGILFGEPARAISRNVLVIAIGFLPLLAAPLVPYKTVGIFLCAIMALSGMITLLVLPAILRIAAKVLFRKSSLSKVPIEENEV